MNGPSLSEKKDLPTEVSNDIAERAQASRGVSPLRGRGSWGRGARVQQLSPSETYRLLRP
jgi:hypothetical protein